MKVRHQSPVRIANTTGQKKHFRHPRFITNFHLDPTEELLADPHSLSNNQRGKEGKARSVMMSYPPTNTKKAEDPTKTLSTPQKRLRNAHLRSKSTPRPRASTHYRPAALRDREANKAVISDPPAARRYARASTNAARPVITTAAASNRRVETTPINIVKTGVSNNKNAKSASIYAKRSTQISGNNTSEKYLQRQNCQINTANVQTLFPFRNSANKCRSTGNASIEKITTEETPPYAKSCRNRLHEHWFRRKKRQKAEETTKENRRP